MNTHDVDTLELPSSVLDFLHLTLKIYRKSDIYARFHSYKFDKS